MPEPIPYRWLADALDARLPRLLALSEGQEPEARAWFDELLAVFIGRGLDSPSRQKNYLTATRNAIRAQAPGHFSLEIVAFDEATWEKINAKGHDAMEARAEGQTLLHDVDTIVGVARNVIHDPDSQWAELVAALALATGRRFSELVGVRSRFEATGPFTVRFTGQRKRPEGEAPFAFEIPTLVDAAAVVDAWTRLRTVIGSEALSARQLNNRFGPQANQAARTVFGGLVPARPGKETLYTHLFRAVYATIAVHWFCPPHVNRITFLAEIQGHRQVFLAPNEELRRSYVAARHYDDFQVADGKGNLDGRQGVRLGAGGVEPLTVFQRPPGPFALPGEAATASTAPASPSATVPTVPTVPLSPAPMKDTAAVAEPVSEPISEPVAKPPSADPAPPVITRSGRTLWRCFDEDCTRLEAFRVQPPEGLSKTERERFNSQAQLLHRALDRAERAGRLADEADRLRTLGEEAAALGHRAAGRAEELTGQVAAAEARATEAETRLENATARLLKLELDAASAASASPGVLSAADASTLTDPLFSIAGQLTLLDPALAGQLASLAQRFRAIGRQPIAIPRPRPYAEPAAAGTPAGIPEPAEEINRFAPSAVHLLNLPPHARTPQVATQSYPAASASANVPTPPGLPLAVSAAKASDTPASAPEAITGTPAAGAGPSAPAPDQPDGAGAAANADANMNAGAAASAAPKPKRAPGRRRHEAFARLQTILNLLTAHNDNAPLRDDKWCVTTGTLQGLSGSHIQVVADFVKEHQQEINAHNQRHGLSPGLNRSHGKRGGKPEDIMGVLGVTTAGAATAGTRGTQYD